MKPTKSIAFAGILAALHVGALLIAKFAPGFQILLLFFLPFFSAIYSIKADAKYCLIYFISTLLVSIGVDLAVNFDGSSLFYILPSLVSGLLYGFLAKKKQSGTTIIYALTIAQFGLILLGALAVKSILNEEYLKTIEHFFELSAGSVYLALGLILFYCFAQSFLVHIITKNELKKIKFEVVKAKRPPLWLFFLTVVSIIACFIPFKNNLFIFFAAVSTVVFGIAVALYGYQSTDKVWIILAAQAVVFLAGSLIILKNTEGYAQIKAYIILFIPPLVLAFINVFKDDQPKQIKTN